MHASAISASADMHALRAEIDEFAIHGNQDRKTRVKSSKSINQKDTKCKHSRLITSFTHRAAAVDTFHPTAHSIPCQRLIAPDTRVLHVVHGDRAHARTRVHAQCKLGAVGQACGTRHGQ